jgi:hypothetical protein
VLDIWSGFATKAEELFMPPPAKDQVFISYSHEDTKWREDLEKHLKPYLRGGSIVSWSDQQIAPGSKWFKEIQLALANSKVAVLLVTPDFLASDFIYKHELGPLLKEAEQGGVKILWVPVRESAYKQTPLENYHALLDPIKPLASMTQARRDKAWVKISEDIEKQLTAEESIIAPSSRQILKLDFEEMLHQDKYISQRQKEILTIVCDDPSRNPRSFDTICAAIRQKVKSLGQASNDEIYYRLEQLYLLRFLEKKQPIDVGGKTWSRHWYRASSEFVKYIEAKQP